MKTALVDAVLPLIRTRTDLHRCAAAHAHGTAMHEAVDILEAAEGAGPADRFDVTSGAIVSAMTVIARADDSAGIIGDECRRSLALHPRYAADAHAPAAPWSAG